MRDRTENPRAGRLNAVDYSTMPDWRRIMFVVLLLSIWGVESGLADGSKDLYRPGTSGRRAYLFSRVNSVGGDDRSWPFRTFGEHFVYVNEGEILAIASSAHGYGTIGGKFRLTSPKGNIQEIPYNGTQATSGYAEVLDELARTLRDNSTLKIELASHTDSRGSDRYNLSLSQRRAQAAVDYLVSRGICPRSHGGKRLR